MSDDEIKKTLGNGHDVPGLSPEPKTDELGVSFIVTEWISELPLEVSALHEVTHENWQELYAQLRLYVDQKVLKGRLVELDLLEQAMNREWPHRPAHNWVYRHKLERLEDLENRLTAPTAPQKEKLQYTAIIEGENEIQSPFFDTEGEVWGWLKVNDASGVKDGAYQIQGFTKKEIEEMPSDE